MGYYDMFGRNMRLIVWGYSWRYRWRLTVDWFNDSGLILPNLLGIMIAQNTAIYQPTSNSHRDGKLPLVPKTIGFKGLAPFWLVTTSNKHGCHKGSDPCENYLTEVTCSELKCPSKPHKWGIISEIHQFDSTKSGPWFTCSTKEGYLNTLIVYYISINIYILYNYIYIWIKNCPEPWYHMTS